MTEIVTPRLPFCPLFMLAKMASGEAYANADCSPQCAWYMATVPRTKLGTCAVTYLAIMLFGKKRLMKQEQVHLKDCGCDKCSGEDEALEMLERGIARAERSYTE